MGDLIREGNRAQRRKADKQGRTNRSRPLAHRSHKSWHSLFEGYSKLQMFMLRIYLPPETQAEEQGDG